MNLNCLKNAYGLTLLITLLLTTTLSAQVGINTTSPSSGSILDVESSDKGMLVPRVNIADLSTIAPISGGSTTSLLVYNTNTSTGPGFFYWDGSNWVGIDGDNDWDLEGNAGTTPGTGANQNYIGTSDSQELLLATNGTEALTISTSQRIHAENNGSESAPTYSFDSDTNTGMYRSTSDRLNFTAGGREILEIRESGDTSEMVVNDSGDRTNFRIGTDGEPNMLFTDGTNDRLGILTNTPQNDVHISGTSTGIRIDAFNSANDSENNGVDVAAIYVDANGDLTLEGPLVLNNMPEDNLTTFVPTATYIGSSVGAWSQAAIYSTTITLTQDALVEVVYQIGVNMTDAFGLPITDGDPRQYGTALFIDTNLVGYTSECYTSSGTGQITSGTFFLNGNGYAQLTGAPAGTTYTVTVYGFTFGGDDGTSNGDSTLGEFGGNTGIDRFQLILHH